MTTLINISLFCTSGGLILAGVGVLMIGIGIATWLFI